MVEIFLADRFFTTSCVVASSRPPANCPNTVAFSNPAVSFKPSSFLHNEYSCKVRKIRYVGQRSDTTS